MNLVKRLQRLEGQRRQAVTMAIDQLSDKDLEIVACFPKTSAQMTETQWGAFERYLELYVSALDKVKRF